MPSTMLPKRAPAPAQRPTQPGGGIVRSALSAKALLILSTLLRASAAICLMPLLVSSLGPELYGLWVTVTTVTMYLSLSESGLGQTVVNEIGRSFALDQKERISQIMATAFVMYCVVVAVAGTAAVGCILSLPIGDYLLSPADAAKYEPLLKSCLVVSTVLAFLRIPTLVFPGLLIGVRRLPLRVTWEVGGSLLALAAMVTVALYGGGLVGLTIAANLSLLLMSAAICLSSRRCGDWAKLRLRNFRSALVRPLLVSSAFYGVISIATVLDRSLTLLLAPRFGSLEAIPAFFLITSAYRSAAYSLIAAIPKSVQPYIVMWTAKRQLDSLRTVTQFLTKATSAIAIAIVAAFTPVADIATNAWLGYGAFPGYALYTLIAAAFLLDAVTCTPAFVLVSMNRQRVLAFVLIGKGIATAALAAVLAPHHESPLTVIAGAALATSMLSTVSIPFLIRHAVDAPWLSHASHNLARPIALACVFLAASLVAANYLSVGGKVAASVLLSLATLPAACYLLLNAQERSLAGGAIHSVAGRFLPDRLPRS